MMVNRGRKIERNEGGRENWDERMTMMENKGKGSDEG